MQKKIKGSTQYSCMKFTRGHKTTLLTFECIPLRPSSGGLATVHCGKGGKVTAVKLALSNG